MSTTYTSLYYHLIFGTKERIPMIDRDWRPKLHAYMGGILRHKDINPVCIGGTSDHVHLLMELKASHVLSDVVRELKKAASVWVHEEMGETKFAWQVGYAAFTVSVKNLSRIESYIQNQEVHHKTRSFRDELIALFDQAGITYKTEYVP